MTCVCGHPKHFHHGDCRVASISGPPSDLDRHEGRTIRFCMCRDFEAAQ